VDEDKGREADGKWHEANKQGHKADKNWREEERSSVDEIDGGKLLLKFPAFVLINLVCKY
jgi:hypothetical protein